MKFTEQEIMEAYDKSAEYTQEVIWAPETKQLVDRVTDQNGIMTREQKDIVADELMYLLLGLTTENEMILRLNDELSLSGDTVVKLVKDIVEPIFGKSVSTTSQEKSATSTAIESSYTAPSNEVVSTYNPSVPEKLELQKEDPRQQPTVPAFEPIPSEPDMQNVPDANPYIREKLELRPEETQRQQQTEVDSEETVSTRPLTREDVLNALSSKRTMASDIESVRTNNDGSEE